MEPLSYSLYATFSLPFTILLAFLMDCALGDPEGAPHVVRLMGNLIAFFERQLNRLSWPPRKRRACGYLVALALPALCTLMLSALLRFLYGIYPPLYAVFRVILCWQLIAVKNLADEAKAVASVLEKQGLAAGRKQLSRIVGRETDSLSQQDCIQAAVETVAENFCDGVAAPLLFLALLDLPGLFFYKMVNTLDSMIGYRTARFIDFGCASARLDDLLNFIPARLSALWLILSAWLCGQDPVEAFKIFKRDRNKHLSPNSGQTESVMAGALHIQLGGGHFYHGEWIDKPTLGDPQRPAEIQDVQRACQMLYTASALCLLCVLIAISWRLRR